jgi:hypothetical protein
MFRGLGKLIRHEGVEVRSGGLQQLAASMLDRYVHTSQAVCAMKHILASFGDISSISEIIS